MATSQRADVVELLLADVFKSRESADLFNPYADRRPGIDLADAARIRRENLATVLRIMCVEPIEEIWIGEAVWRHLDRRRRLPLLWNSVLHHPHRPNDSSTNRTPTERETAAFASTRALLRKLAPDARVIAIGRVAERSSGEPVTYVRHPAQRGRAVFDTQLPEMSG